MKPGTDIAVHASISRRLAVAAFCAVLPALLAFMPDRARGNENPEVERMLELRDRGRIGQLASPVDRPTGHVLPRGRMELGLDMRAVNDSLDLFGIKEDAAPDELGFGGGAGDLRGFRTHFRFGLTDSLSLVSKFSRDFVDYGSGEVDLRAYDLALRFSIYEDRGITGIALELIGSHREGIQGGRVSFGGVSRNVSVSGLSTDSARMNAIVSRKFASRLAGNFFLGYKNAKVDAKSIPGLSGEDDLDELTDREQRELSVGLGADVLIARNWMWTTTAESISFNRDPRVKGAPEQQLKAETRLHYQLNDRVAFHAEMVYFEHFFAGEYPFLLNERTADTFDSPYGFVGLGVVFRWDYADSRPKFAR